MIRKWHCINIYNGNFGPVEITLILTNTQFYFMKHLIQSKFRIFAILAIAAIFGQVSAFAQQRAITGTVLDGTGQPDRQTILDESKCLRGEKL